MSGKYHLIIITSKTKIVILQRKSHKKLVKHQLYCTNFLVLLDRYKQLIICVCFCFSQFGEYWLVAFLRSIFSHILYYSMAFRAIENPFTSDTILNTAITILIEQSITVVDLSLFCELNRCKFTAIKAMNPGGTHIGM